MGIISNINNNNEKNLSNVYIETTCHRVEKLLDTAILVPVLVAKMSI